MTDTATTVPAAVDGIRAAAVGAGRMGRGIAIALAWAGVEVSLVDSEARDAAQAAAAADATRAELAIELRLLADTGVLAPGEAGAMAARIALVPRARAAVALREAAFVFEAVLEVLEVKRATWAWLDPLVAPDAIVASTTSTMLPDALAALVVDPSRYTNAHWLNPAYLMPLVEISPSARTAPATVARLRAFLEGCGKAPVTCRASPGYIVARVQALALNEAARLYEEGVASAEDIDRAIRLGFGIRYSVFGLLEFIDWGGGDILHHASNYLAGTLDAARFAPPAIVERHMRDGHNGMRDGQGFYDYRDRDLAAYRRARLGEFVALLDRAGLLPPALRGRTPGGERQA